MNNTTPKTIIITSYVDKDFDMISRIHQNDFIICTDGGYNIALSHHIKPDLVLGDFDSIKTMVPSDIPIQRFNPEKDFTDLELAIKTAMEKNSFDVEIWGGMGGRFDHTIANVQLLSHYSPNFDSLIMMDGDNKCFVLIGPLSNFFIPQEENSYLSLFSLSEKCMGVTIENVKYPLHHHTLTRTCPLGVSNEITKKNAVLSMENGTMLIIISRS